MKKDERIVERANKKEKIAKDKATVAARKVARDLQVADKVNNPVRDETDIVVKRQKCSNTGCITFGTKLEVKSWTGCRKKACKLLFCGNCEKTDEAHMEVCIHAAGRKCSSAI